MARVKLYELNSTDGLQNAYLGDRPMSAILVGTDSVVMTLTKEFDGNFGAPKDGSILIPEWATSVAYVVSGAGKGGADGDGGWGGTGKGGTGGEFIIGHREIDPDGRNSINYSLGGGYSRGRNGDPSSITLNDGLVIEAKGATSFKSGQSGSAQTHPETDVDKGQSADDWLTRLKVSRNSNDGTRYRPGTGGSGNAGAGKRGGGGAGGNGGVFGNYTPGGFGGPGYVKLVFWGFDQTVYGRDHELFFKPNDQVFAANFEYEVPGGDSKGLLVPQDDLTTLSNFDNYYHSEYISYLDDYTFGIKKAGDYFVVVNVSDPDTGELLEVSEVSIIVKDSSGSIKSQQKETRTYTCTKEGALEVGDVIVPSVKTRTRQAVYS